MVPRGDHFIQVNWDLLPVLIKNIKLPKNECQTLSGPTFYDYFQGAEFSESCESQETVSKDFTNCTSSLAT